MYRTKVSSIRRLVPYLVTYSSSFLESAQPVQLKEGTYYTDKFFKEGITITENNTQLSDDKIESFDTDEEYSHYVDALQWLEFKQYEITGMPYAAKKMIV